MAKRMLSEERSLRKRRRGEKAYYNINYHPDRAIELGEQGCTLVQICRDFNITKKTLREWREKFPEFAEAVEMAKERAQAYWEDLNHEGALGKIKNFNHRAVEFRMKNQFKEDYTETKHIQTTNLLVNLSEEDLLKRIQVKIASSPELLEHLKSHPAMGQLMHEKIIEVKVLKQEQVQ